MAKTAKKSKAQAQKELAEKLAARGELVVGVLKPEVEDPVVEEEHEDMTTEQAEVYTEVEGELEPEDKVPNSIVKDKFKKAYIENARNLGLTGKVARRSNWDWLAQTLAEHCLSEKGKISINDFVDILDANGVDHSRWTNRNKGWEGRFRMTGRVALQKVVANAGVLKTMVSEVVPPAEWIAKYKDKE